MNIYLVFYTPSDSDQELFLSAHATVESAKAAAEADAVDQGWEGWNWGDGAPDGNLPNGHVRDPRIFTDWGDLDDSGYYQFTEVPLHGVERFSPNTRTRIVRGITKFFMGRNRAAFGAHVSVRELR